MPQRLRNPDGQVVEVADDDVGFYQSRGWQPESYEQASADATRAVSEDDRGIIGDINSAATGFLSGATLGASDVLLSEVATDNERRQLAADREASPISGGVGQLAGAILPALAAPTSLLGSMPSGFLARYANEGVSAARAIGGAKGAARLLTAGGVEGAVQNAGAYIADTALGDRDLTAEGISGALGTGFAFGAAGGGAFYGVERGTIAARRLFARTAEGGAEAAAVAEEAWKRTAKETVDANDSAVEVARTRLKEAKEMRARMDIERQRAGAVEAEVKAAEARPRPAADVPVPASVADAPQVAPVTAAPTPSAAAALPDDVAKLEPLIAKYDAAKLDFDAALEQSMLGVKAPDLGTFGPWKTKRYEPQQWPPELPDAVGGRAPAAGDLANAPLEVRASSLDDALDIRARQLDATNVVRRPSLGSRALKESPIAGSIDAPEAPAMVPSEWRGRPDPSVVDGSPLRRTDTAGDAVSDAPVAITLDTPISSLNLEQAKEYKQLLSMRRWELDPGDPELSVLDDLTNKVWEHEGTLVANQAPTTQAAPQTPDGPPSVGPAEIPAKVVSAADEVSVKSSAAQFPSPELVTGMRQKLHERAIAGYAHDADGWPTLTHDAQDGIRSNLSDIVESYGMHNRMKDADYSRAILVHSPGQENARLAIPDGAFGKHLNEWTDYPGLMVLPRRQLDDMIEHSKMTVDELHALGRRAVAGDHDAFLKVFSAHVMNHEATHGFGPIISQGAHRTFLEELTTELSARRMSADMHGFPSHTKDVIDSYDAIIHPVIDVAAKTAGVSREAAYDAWESAALKFKSRTGDIAEDNAIHDLASDAMAALGVTDRKSVTAMTQGMYKASREMGNSAAASRAVLDDVAPKAEFNPPRPTAAAPPSAPAPSPWQRSQDKTIVAIARHPESPRQFAVREADAAGQVADRTVSRDEAMQIANDSMPAGYKLGVPSPGGKPFQVRSGIPDDLAKLDDNTVYVMRPSDLVARGSVLGNEINEANRASISAARTAAERLPPIDIDVTPDGKFYVEDGNHRLQAAARAGDEQIAVHLRRTAPDWKPQRGARDINGRLQESISESTTSRTAAGTGAASADDSLERQLLGTKAKLDAGGALSDTEAAFQRASRSVDLGPQSGRYEGSAMAAEERAMQEQARALRAEYDGLVARAAKESDDVVHAEIVAKADAVEAQLTGIGKRPALPDEVAAIAEPATRLEAAAADVTEALGDAAPPAAVARAKAFREAEDMAERKTMDRTTRAVDDHLEDQDLESLLDNPSRPRTAKEERAAARKAARAEKVSERAAAREAALESRAAARASRENSKLESDTRIGAARSARLDADAAYANAKVAESEAKIGERAALAAAKESQAAAKSAVDTVSLPGASSQAPGRSRVGGLADLGAAVEVAASLGIPGLPQPSDIPVIGPLLGAYLKFRALKVGVGRFTGRIPATGEAKAAALAAQTRDKIARAVDKSLGIIHGGAAAGQKHAARATATVAGILERRAFDDGEPDAPKGASVTQKAAVRIREVSYAATNPDKVIAGVRREMRGVADPDLIAAVERHRVALFTHLNDTAPKAPPPTPYVTREWEPSPALAMQWGRRLQVANDPLAAFEALQRQSLTPEAAETLRKVWPRLFAQAQARLVERAADVTEPIPYQQRLRNSLLFDVPLDPSVESSTMKILQSAYSPSTMPADPMTPPQPDAPPVPSIAGPANLTALYQTGSDRRSQMR